ncbi:MAG: ferric reductase-like transmembrane domain-containing protein [Candidatus Diapherotrites archaeon]|nr:ferric reductase-like transmembrane domain-containing protein [Candidatus Diapherotrites archaeon]
MKGEKTWVSIIIALLLLLLYSFLFPLPPQTILIRFFALGGFFLLCVTLLIGPSFVCIGNNCSPLLKHRRRIGVLSFIFVATHFLLVLIYSYNLSLAPILSNVWALLAVPALIILFVLALTSVNKVIQVFGFSSWKLLQRFVYLAFVLSFIHFINDTNGLFIPLTGGKVFVVWVWVRLRLLTFLR